MDRQPHLASTAPSRGRDTLVAVITAAFDGVLRKEGTTLHQAMAIDDYKPEADQLAARRLDPDRRWQEVPDEAIEEQLGSPLSFLDAEGFRYYLPAYMIYGLRNMETVEGVDILSSCRFHLLHESGKSLRKSEPASIARRYHFTAEQSRAVYQFLKFLEGDTTTAVERQAAEKWEKYVALRHAEPTT